MSKDELIEAINKFFGDTSRSREETAAGLEEALSTIETMLETLED